MTVEAVGGAPAAGVHGPALPAAEAAAAVLVAAPAEQRALLLGLVDAHGHGYAAEVSRLCLKWRAALAGAPGAA